MRLACLSAINLISSDLPFLDTNFPVSAIAHKNNNTIFTSNTYIDERVYTKNKYKNPKSNISPSLIITREARSLIIYFRPWFSSCLWQDLQIFPALKFGNRLNFTDTRGRFQYKNKIKIQVCLDPKTKLEIPKSAPFLTKLRIKLSL